MTKKQEIKIFEDKKVRTVWDSETEQWYFCVADVVEVLTDSKNPTDYIKKMKKRDPSLAEGWGQIVTPPFCTDSWRKARQASRLSRQQRQATICCHQQRTMRTNHYDTTIRYI